MLEIAAAAPEEQQAVLSLLLSGCGDGERVAQTGEMLAAQRRGELSLEGLLKATRNGELLGAGLYVVPSQECAFVWPPGVSTVPDRDGVADAVLQEICRRVDAEGVWISQCLLESGPGSGRDRSHTRPFVRRALVRSGFEHLADLFYLQRPLDKSLPAAADVSFETVPFCQETNFDRFAQIVERTYVDTLDCPGFHGHRTGADALRSHQLSGRFAPERWKLYRVGGRDVGVLLMTDHPEQGCWEVVYMGIVPEARGKGYGRRMLCCGLREARRAGRESVLLAVDGNNVYANRIYSELGFVEVARRAAHVRYASGEAPVANDESDASASASQGAG